MTIPPRSEESDNGRRILCAGTDIESRMIIGVKGKVLPHPDGCIIDIENGTINGVLLVKGLKIEGDEVGIVLHKLLTTHESST